MTTLTMTFGRFNPPTTGHELLVKKMMSIRNSAECRIYISPTVGKNNPLDFEYRYKLLNKAFAGPEVIVSEVQHKDVFAAIKFVDQLGYAGLNVVIGGDRFKELSKRIPQYNGELYKFAVLNVYNAGDRDESDTLAGMSASKMREAAKLGDYETFESGLPHKLRSMSRDIYQRVREACQESRSLSI